MKISWLHFIQFLFASFFLVHGNPFLWSYLDDLSIKSAEDDVSSHHFDFYSVDSSFSLLSQIDTLHRSVQLSFSESLGERSNLFLTDLSEWSVSIDQNIILRGTGTELNSHRFEMPGEYNIRIFEKHIHVEGGCVHPDQLHLIKLNVASSKAELVYDQSFWHQILSTQKSFAEDTLLLPIRVRYYDEAMPIQNLQVSLSGVNCTLRGVQNKEAILPPNEITLVPFVLNGQVGTGIYAMLDFIDQNGNTTANSITQIIN